MIKLETHVLSSKEHSLEHLKFYPNPVQNLLNITSKTVIDKVTVLNSLGQLIVVKTPNTKHLKLSTKNLATGLYFVKVVSDETSRVIRITKK